MLSEKKMFHHRFFWRWTKHSQKTPPESKIEEGHFFSRFSNKSHDIIYFTFTFFKTFRVNQKFSLKYGCDGRLELDAERVLSQARRQ